MAKGYRCEGHVDLITPGWRNSLKGWEQGTGPYKYCEAFCHYEVDGGGQVSDPWDTTELMEQERYDWEWKVGTGGRGFSGCNSYC